MIPRPLFVPAFPAFLAFLAFIGFPLCSAVAQQITTCTTAPIGDSSNRCASTQFVQQNGGGGGGGGISSLGLVMPNIFSVSTPNPILPPSGTFTVTLGNQSANTVFAGPTTGAAAAPTFRALVSADLPAGTGTVTSVGMTVPGILSVSPASISTSGTFALTLANQAANTIFAGPTMGAAAAPTFRASVLADLPSIVTGTVLGNLSGSTGAPMAITLPSCGTVTTSTSFLVSVAGSSIGCSAFSGPTSVANSDGTLTISPTTGAVVASLALGHANTWTAAQTFTNSDILLLGSSTGATTFTSANAGASNFTLTFPAATDTVVTLAAAQTLTNKSIAATQITGQLALANGGTNANLAASNGGIFYSTASAGAILAGTVTAGQCLLSGSNAAPSWGSCSGAAAVSSVSNSDGTLTISPTTGAVVASLALGHANTWTAVQTFTNSDLALLGSSTGVTTFTSANAGASNFTITVPAATDTLVTLAAAQTLTNKSIAGSEINSGLVALSVGGTNANLTASNGGLLYSTASALAILAGTATANQIPLSGASAAPTWSTATYPATTIINQLLYSSSTNVIGGLATANSSILATNGSGVPALTGTLPFTVPVSTGGTGATTFTANLPLIGNGTAAIAQGSRSGSTTTFGTTSGTLTSGNCVQFDASGNLVDAGAVCGGGGGGAATIVAPQGRLTLTANTPVMTASANAQTTLRYDCYVGGNVPYYTGSADALDTIASCEVTDAMVSAASAGQVVGSNVYDAWWVHAGANRICLAMSASTGGGGGWSSDTGGSNTARGTGYTQLDYTRGYITNKNAITNCFNGATNYGSVAARQATYLGTIASDASAGQVSYTFGASAAGGTAAVHNVWNMYNRVNVGTVVQDSNSSYSWTNAANALRAADGSNAMRVTYVIGVSEDPVTSEFFETSAVLGGVASVTCYVGIGVDSTTVNSAALVGGFQGSSIGDMLNRATITSYNAGSHFLQALDGIFTTNSQTCRYHPNTSNLTVSSSIPYVVGSFTANLRM